MFGRRPQMKEGAYIFATIPDDKFKKIAFGMVTGVDGNKIGINGLVVDPVGLKNKVEQSKAGPSSLEALESPNSKNCIFSLIYRVEHDNFAAVLDLIENEVEIISPKAYNILDGWIRESLPEMINKVLSLPPGTEQDQAKRLLKGRMDTLLDKNLRLNLYSVCRSLKILN